MDKGLHAVAGILLGPIILFGGGSLLGLIL